MHQNLHQTLCKSTSPALTHSYSLKKSCLSNVSSIANKSFLVNDFIVRNNIDIFCTTETWVSPGDVITLNEVRPSDFSCFNVPRPKGRGGGLVVLFESVFKCHSVLLGDFKSFELLSFIISGPPLYLSF